MDRKRHHKNELQTTTREAGAEGQRPATAGNTYTSSAARRAAGGRRQPLVGVATPVSRQRPLGRPLSARAGRVAKEMTAPSAAPRRGGRAGSGAAPFPLPLPLCSCPVTASWPASRLSPAPCVAAPPSQLLLRASPGLPASAPARVAPRSTYP